MKSEIFVLAPRFLRILAPAWKTITRNRPSQGAPAKSSFKSISLPARSEFFSCFRSIQSWAADWASCQLNYHFVASPSSRLICATVHRQTAAVEIFPPVRFPGSLKITGNQRNHRRVIGQMFWNKIDLDRCRFFAGFFISPL